MPSMDSQHSGSEAKKSKKASLLMAQDVKYSRKLSDNDEKTRKRALKYLKKYLEQRSQSNTLEEENIKVLWQGLFYSMWMSDKLLIQEDCAESISQLIHCLQFQQAMLFFKIGLVTLQTEWIGVDQLRLDKFLMLVRRLLRQVFVVLKGKNFKKKFNQVFGQVLEETILATTTNCLGLFMHFTEIYLEELAKISDGKLHSTRTIDFLRPYVHKLAFATDNRIVNWINKFIFTHLMKQHKLGIEYQEKYLVWKQQSFVGSINQVQKIVLNDEEENSEEDLPSMDKPLDPRAGRVDVELAQILFDAKELSEVFDSLKTDPKTTKNTRNHLRIWSEKFLKLHNGVYPLGVKKLFGNKKNEVDMKVTKAAKRLIKFEEKLLDKGPKKGKKRPREEDLEEVVEEEEPVSEEDEEDFFYVEPGTLYLTSPTKKQKKCSDEVSGFLVETIVKDVPITQSNLRQKNDKALSKLRGKARVD